MEETFLFDYELTFFTEFKSVIRDFTPSTNSHGWRWHESSDEIYFVSSAYSYLLTRASPPRSSSLSCRASISAIWCNMAPSKVIAFSWQLLKQRIPTIDNLLKRGVHFISGTISCPLCSLHIETTSHLFVTCEVASSVWYQICRWLGGVLFYLEIS